MVSKIKRSKKLFVLLSCLDCNGQGPAGRQSLVSEWPRLAGAAAHSPWAHGWDLGHLPEPGPGKVGSGEGAVGTRSGAGREESWVPPSQLRISAGWGPVDGRVCAGSIFSINLRKNALGDLLPATKDLWWAAVGPSFMRLELPFILIGKSHFPFFWRWRG